MTLALLILLWQQPAPPPGPRPVDVPAEWQARIGEYGPDNAPVLVFEKDGALWMRRAGGEAQPLGDDARFTACCLETGRLKLARRPDPAAPGQTFRITPQLAPEKLREIAAGAPPPQPGNFRKPDLVELVKLDRTIRLDIRYASDNNFMGMPFYTQARAFLQRPAAEALVRAHRKLKPFGYGLLIHDGYRPWAVTKMFYEATPPAQREFVANPAQGSRHNRGAAVDLSLYELATGEPARMPSGYDEFSRRAYPDYEGGTSLERWRRDLLRWAMESEGFRVAENEWWHFDYRDWREYPVLNVPFEKLR